MRERAGLERGADVEQSAVVVVRWVYDFVQKVVFSFLSKVKLCVCVWKNEFAISNAKRAKNANVDPSPGLTPFY